MNRKPLVKIQELTDEEKEVFERISTTRGGVWGPYSVLMRIPELAGRIADVGEFIRFKSKLPARTRELAILAVAVENDCAFEWHIHEPIARNAGIGSDEIAKLAAGESPESFPEPDKSVVKAVRSLSEKKRINDDLFATLKEQLGEDELLELISLIGFYTLLACLINAYEVLPSS